MKIVRYLFSENKKRSENILALIVLIGLIIWSFVIIE